MKKKFSLRIENSDLHFEYGNAIEKSERVNGVVEFHEKIPAIKIFENGKLSKTFLIETLQTNSDLSGQFLHFSVGVQTHGGVMIDGIFSKDKNSFTTWEEPNYEAIRLQPFFLKIAEDMNKSLIGKGLFARGLHYAGTVTPSGVRNICLCDFCAKSFTIQHFHAGFSECQYFYSDDSSETLIVPLDKIENMPAVMQYVDDVDFEKIESQLPLPKNGLGKFRFYNSFCCPHCKQPYIDFKKFPEMRVGEYYGNKYLNEEFSVMK